MVVSGQFSVLIGVGAEFDKDDVSLHFTATALMQRVGNYWHMLPEYGQARKAIWEAVNPKTGKRRIDEAFPPEIRSNTRNQEMMIKFVNGSTWQLVGSDSYNALVGSPPIGLVNSEYALADPQAWGYLSPILEENSGWSIFVFSARGKNHGFTLLKFAETEPGWFAETLTVDDTPVFTIDQQTQILRDLKGIYGETEGLMLFMQEYKCSFEGFIHGAYYAKQVARARQDGCICSVPHETGHEVYTFWDLGVDDSTTVWFMQAVGRELRFIDYYENIGEGMEHYAKVLKEKPYVYGDHYMPHDADARKQGEKVFTIKQVSENLGIRPIIIVKRAKDTEAVRRGIEAARNIFSRCWFDKIKCSQGLSGLEAYRAEYDEKNKKLGNRPLHNWASHAADGFRTFSVGYTDKAIIDDVIIPGQLSVGVSGWAR